MRHEGYIVAAILLVLVAVMLFCHCFRRRQSPNSDQPAAIDPPQESFARFKSNLDV